MQDDDDDTDDEDLRIGTLRTLRSTNGVINVLPDIPMRDSNYVNMSTTLPMEADGLNQNPRDKDGNCFSVPGERD